MKLDEFHVHEFGAGFIRESHAVASVFPGVGSDAPGLADATGGDDDGLCFENNEAASFAPVGKGAGNAAVVSQKPSDGAFHVDVDALLDATVLKSANHFEAGAVTNVTEAFEGMTAEGALQNVAIFRAVEEGAPLFEFADAIGRFLGVKLGHAPIVEKFSAAHGVAKMRFPIVGGVHVGHGRGDTAFGHYGVSFAKKRFADDADGGALGERFERRPQSRATGANDENVVLAGLVVCGHRSLRSRIAPLASMRT